MGFPLVKIWFPAELELEFVEVYPRFAPPSNSPAKARRRGTNHQRSPRLPRNPPDTVQEALLDAAFTGVPSLEIKVEFWSASFHVQVSAGPKPALKSIPCPVGRSYSASQTSPTVRVLVVELPVPSATVVLVLLFPESWSAWYWYWKVLEFEIDGVVWDVCVAFQLNRRACSQRGESAS